ncbi:hypothetical protein HHX48_02925 [Salinimonas sp. HHU 13199]|uniref:Uncharacterized protein n=1 Tax=Salinimonas profundi TaxID=2729140 RepID=A0ABR8LEH1_9ALTE|nr:hypothetical protein [Salinimonas profundi]MBD3584686.1 hypothetical protein [Salinimonas profundi]
MDYAYWFKRTYPELRHISFDDVDSLIERITPGTAIMLECIKVCCIVIVLVPTYTTLFYSGVFSLHGAIRWTMLLTALYGALLFGRRCEQSIIKAYLKSELLNCGKPRPTSPR